MVRVLFPLLLLLGPALAGDCTADIALKEGERKVIESKHFRESHTNIDLLMKPDLGFKGVQLVISGSNGVQNNAWFPTDPQCFVFDGMWRKFSAIVWRKKNDLIYTFDSSTCKRRCNMIISVLGPKTLSVVAYGNSMWNKDRPATDCRYMQRNIRSSTNHTCQHLPSITTTMTYETLTTYKTPMTNETTTNHSASNSSATPSSRKPSQKTIIIATSTAVLVMAAAVVVVVVVYWKRKPYIAPAPPKPTQQINELHVIDGNLYDSLDSYDNHDSSPVHRETTYTTDYSGYDHIYESID